MKFLPLCLRESPRRAAVPTTLLNSSCIIMDIFNLLVDKGQTRPTRGVPQALNKGQDGQCVAMQQTDLSCFVFFFKSKLQEASLMQAHIGIFWGNSAPVSHNDQFGGTTYHSWESSRRSRSKKLTITKYQRWQCEGDRGAGGMAANKEEGEGGRKTRRYAKGFSMFNFQIGLSGMTFSWRLQAQQCLSWYWYAGGALLVTGTNTVDEWGAFLQEGVKCKFEMREKENGRKRETKEYRPTQIELQWRSPGTSSRDGAAKSVNCSRKYGLHICPDWLISWWKWAGKCTRPFARSNLDARESRPPLTNAQVCGSWRQLCWDPHFGNFPPQNLHLNRESLTL